MDFILWRLVMSLMTGDAYLLIDKKSTPNELYHVQTDLVKFGYSYDLTVSELTPATGGAHEVSMTLQFDCRGKRSKFRTISCPAF
jgi:hypothetical protein